MYFSRKETQPDPNLSYIISSHFIDLWRFTNKGEGQFYRGYLPPKFILTREAENYKALP